jgi:uncharacterized protein
MKTADKFGQNVRFRAAARETTPAMQKENALMKAAKAGHIDVVRVLVDAGDRRGRLRALTGGICWGEWIDEKDHCGETALIKAAEAGHIDVVRVLVDAGAAINVANKEGDTPLLAAVAAGNLELVKLFVSWGANVKAVLRNGQGALHLVTQRGCPAPLFSVLRSAGADVDATDNERNTPLMIASMRGLGGVVELLLAAGADVAVKNKVHRWIDVCVCVCVCVGVCVCVCVCVYVWFRV